MCRSHTSIGKCIVMKFYRNWEVELCKLIKFDENHWNINCSDLIHNFSLYAKLTQMFTKKLINCWRKILFIDEKLKSYWNENMRNSPTFTLLILLIRQIFIMSYQPSWFNHYWRALSLVHLKKLQQIYQKALIELFNFLRLFHMTSYTLCKAIFQIGSILNCQVT